MSAIDTPSTPAAGWPIDRDFDVAFADALARIESYNKHHYRPNAYLHKWWARRCGTTFRLILKNLVADPALRDFYTPGGLAGRVILDPMMGGATTLHEAIRLGANVVGADIEPIPVLQARATLSHVPLPALNQAFAQLLTAATAALAPFVSTACPACGVETPFQFILYGQRRGGDATEALAVDSLTLRTDPDGTRLHLDPVTRDVCRDGERLWPAAGEGARPPLVERRDARQLPVDRSVPYVERYEPLAVAGTCADHGAFFKPPDAADRAKRAAAEAERQALWPNRAAFVTGNGSKSENLAAHRVENYLDLFTGRQLRYLAAARDLLVTLPAEERLTLALLVSTSLEFNTLLCGYKGAAARRAGAVRHAFAYHGYAFPSTVLENNPVYPQPRSGTLRHLYASRVARGRRWAARPVERRLDGDAVEKVAIVGERDEGVEMTVADRLSVGERRFLLHHGSGAHLPLPDDSVDFVVTDPPYYDSVQYADLGRFFHVWLRQLLPDAVAWDGASADAPAAVIRQSAVDPAPYVDTLAAILIESRRVLRPAGRLVFTFHHMKAAGWAAVTIALRRAGFRLLNRYVVHAENRHSIHIVKRRTLLHDVIFVCAPEDAAATGGTPWRRVTPSADDSAAFCAACGELVGWCLDAAADEAAIWRTWRAALDAADARTSTNGR